METPRELAQQTINEIMEELKYLVEEDQYKRDAARRLAKRHYDVVINMLPINSWSYDYWVAYYLEVIKELENL